MAGDSLGFLPIFEDYSARVARLGVAAVEPGRAI